MIDKQRKLRSARKRLQTQRPARSGSPTWSEAVGRLSFRIAS
jgi:hypothetical protein